MIFHVVSHSSQLAARTILTAVSIICLTTSLSAQTLYSDRATFESSLATFLVDDYENVGYQSGDIQDSANLDIHSNALMSAIFGETIYTTTGFPDWNEIIDKSGDHLYCAGCNGSYETDFTATTLGTSSGVYGVGFDIKDIENVFGTTAFATFGDDSTQNYTLPDVDTFWGITSDSLIKSIHFGLANGGTNTDNSVQRMAMDNLTIGTKVPEPSGLALLLILTGCLQVASRADRCLAK